MQPTRPPARRGPGATVSTAGSDADSGGRARSGRTPLAVAIAAGIAMLSNLSTLHPEVTSGGLERSLRHEIDRLARAPQPGRPAGPDAPAHPAAAAVLTACSHLATRAYEDAYLALLTARSLL